MFSTTPIADIKTTSEVLPAEINGSGNPVGGIEPDTTAILSITCVAIMQAIPPDNNEPNLSLQPSAILIKKIIKVAKVNITSVAPKKPTSSHIIEKIKSLSANGK